MSFPINIQSYVDIKCVSPNLFYTSLRSNQRVEHFFPHKRPFLKKLKIQQCLCQCLLVCSYGPYYHCKCFATLFVHYFHQLWRNLYLLPQKCALYKQNRDALVKILCCSAATSGQKLHWVALTSQSAQFYQPVTKLLTLNLLHQLNLIF